MSRLASLCLLLIGCASAGDPDTVPVDAPPGGNPDGPPDGGEIPNSACDNKLGMLGMNFESGVAGWTHGSIDNPESEDPDWPYDDWQHGTAAVGPFGGPAGCHEGTGCWATELNDNYTACQRAALVSPTFDLSSCAGRDDVKLSFWSWHDFWTGNDGGTTWFDGGLVELSTNGSSWSAVTPTPNYPGTIEINPDMGGYSCVLGNQFYVDGKQGFVGNGNGWKLVTIPIPANMLTATFRLRFVYSSGVSYQSANAETNRDHTRPGWYIDELAFSAL